MDLSVRGAGPVEPFLGARDLFETECDLSRPVTVRIVEDPNERTRVSHDDDSHCLIISRSGATSAMARELALHEFAHMHHYEQNHPSHTQSTEEAIYLALAGKRVERRKLTHCYQIANHMKDIYADDIWLSVVPADKLISFLESSLAAALADRPPERTAWPFADGTGGDAARRTPAADPEITAVNAAFALGLLERHELLAERHRIRDFARAAASDAPHIEFERFQTLFQTLSPDPDESEYRKALVEATSAYAGSDGATAE